MVICNTVRWSFGFDFLTFAARGSISVAGDMLQDVSHVKVVVNRNSCEVVILLEYIYKYIKGFFMLFQFFQVDQIACF